MFELALVAGIFLAVSTDLLSIAGMLIVVLIAKRPRDAAILGAIASGIYMAILAILADQVGIDPMPHGVLSAIGILLPFLVWPTIGVWLKSRFQARA